MRIGLLGGTFSPPHHGHVICAQEARIQLELDAVWMVPVGDPPHRTLDPSDHPPAELRLSMCRLAVIGQPGLDVCSVELDRAGTSYTVDTLDELVKKDSDNEFTLIVGADQAMAFGNWREPDRIGQLAEVAVAARVDHDRDQAMSEVIRATGGKQPRSIEMPRIDISSSLIRERIYGGNTVSHLGPAGIAEMIEEQKLYA
ncbi:MAG: nicotinate-nucleotide adenylyltransferase [Solirubrobacterales bacterium]